jgi:hypothetical protein
MHRRGARVSVFCPPFGGIDLDPTNDVRVGTDHIVIAWGRDFGDVSPLRGVIVGGRTAPFIGSRFSTGGVTLKSQNHSQENPLAKPNYRHAKKQKEAARKARQDAKQQRRSTVPGAVDAPGVPAEPVPAKSVE